MYAPRGADFLSASVVMTYVLADSSARRSATMDMTEPFALSVMVPSAWTRIRCCARWNVADGKPVMDGTSFDPSSVSHRIIRRVLFCTVRHARVPL